MPIDRQKFTDPATIGYLRDSGLRLEVHCLKCGRMAYVPLDRFPDEAVVPDLSEQHRFSCKQCGSNNCQTRPGHKSGYGEWPKIK